MKTDDFNLVGDSLPSEDSSEPVTLTTQASGETESWPMQPSAPYSRLTPASPVAASVIRYIDHPVTHSLGLAEVTIPLYTVKNGDLEVPIYLSYHGSGIRVDDIAGPAGLGWTLNCGGSMVFQYRGGTSDDMDCANPDKYYDARAWSEAIVGKQDLYRDKIYYSYPAGGGSFMTSRGEDDSETTVRKTCFNNDRIEVGGGYRVTDAQGIQYVYGEREVVTSYGFARGRRDKDPNDIQSIGLGQGKEMVSAYHMSRISSASGKHTVEFAYTELGKVLRETVTSNRLSYSKSIHASDDKPFTVNRQENSFGDGTGTCYHNKVVSEISFNGNKVKFVYKEAPTSPTVGGLPLNGFYYESNPVRRLAEMTVENCDGELIRRIVFDTGDDTFDAKRFPLKDVSFYDGDGNLFDEYRLGYETRVKSADGNFTPVEWSLPLASQDYFGYYNGKENKTLDFIYLYYYEKESVADRSYSFEHAKALSLNFIQRLSGTITDFAYEPNVHHDPRVGDIAIGLRIKEIKTYEDLTAVKSRTFMYGESGCTIDFSRMDHSAYMDRKQYEVRAKDDGRSLEDVVEYIECYPYSLLPGAVVEDAKVFYGKVTETVTDLTTGDAVRTEYGYDTSDWACTWVPQEYVRPERTGEDAWKYVDIQQQSVTPPFDAYQHTVLYIGEIHGYFKEKSPAFGNLTEKTVYETLDDGTFRWVAKSAFSYTKYNESEIFDGHYVKAMVNFPSSYTPCDLYEPEDKPWVHKPNWMSKPYWADKLYWVDINGKLGENYLNDPSADCYHFPIYEDVALYMLTSQEKQENLDGEIRWQKLEFVYSIDDDGYEAWPDEGVQLRTVDREGQTSCYSLRKVKTTLNGTAYLHKYLYAADYGDELYKEMAAANLHHLPLGEETIRDGSKVAAQYIGYRKYAGTDADAAGSQYFMPWKILSKINGIVTEEATVQEYDAFGNPVSILCTGQPETCCVWSYRGSYPVAVVKNVKYDALRTALGGQARIQSIGNATHHDDFIDRLNGLRSYFPEALVTTYTYRPLVGLTSSTDPAGKMTTYHYDAAGRLNAVKDDKGNLVESYEYCIKHSHLS